LMFLDFWSTKAYLFWKNLSHLYIFFHVKILL